MSRSSLAYPFLLLAACSAKDELPETGQTETALVAYRSCEALEADMKEALLEEVEAHFDQQRRWQSFPGPVVEDGAGPPRGDTTTGTPGREEGKDYSGTNNQESGVDEADFVKTDGYHIYLLNGNRLHIYGVPAFGELAGESTLELEGWPSEMLLDKESGRVAVFSHVDATRLPAEHPLRARLGEPDPRGGWYWRMPSVSKITVIDAGDRRAPRVTREIWIEGSYQTARMVERSLRFGAYSYLDVPEVYQWYWAYGTDGQVLSIDEREAAAKAAVRALDLASVIPQIYERLPDRTFQTHSLIKDDCTSFHRPTDSHARGVTSVVTMDLARPALAFDADQIVSNSATIYASLDRLYVAENAHDWWWFWWNEDHEDATNIHAFDIATPGATRYVGSGRVPGVLHNQFSMDEEGGILRLTTTTNQWARWWVDAEERVESKNHVHTLKEQGGRLAKLGHLGDLAPGERVFSSRFEGDRAYIVTFRNIDPLFVIDLSDPAQPKVLGEAKIPGVSTYIQKISDDRLLTIGWGGDDEGLNWRAQVSLFDVADEASPALVDVEPLASATSSGWSEALYQHKAFQYWAPKGLLAVPVSSYESGFDGRGGYWWSYSSKLQLISVGEAGLQVYGTIDHSPYYNSDPDTRWVYTDIRRSIFMGEFIYAISDRGISVHRLADLAKVADATLPGYTSDQMYWWF
jgi:hypothetical protein